MFTFHVDLGQLIITGMIGIIGWFVNMTIKRIIDRLDSHDKSINELSNKIEYLNGILQAMGFLTPGASVRKD